MKKNIRISIILICGIILYSSALFGQEAVGAESQSFDSFLSLQNKGLLKRQILDENDIKGSPYLNEEFILGKIITNKRIQYINVPLRYNIYNDDMEFSVGEDTYLAIADPKSMNRIIIGEDVFIYTIKRNKKGEQFGYYQLLQDGKVKLLSRYNVVFKEGSETTGYKQAEPPRLNRNADTYYIFTENNEPQQISKKKDIELIFSSKSAEVENYIKKEKLNVKNKEDLIKLVQHINESS